MVDAQRYQAAAPVVTMNSAAQRQPQQQQHCVATAIAVPFSSNAVSATLREERSRQGQCVGCGVQLFDVKKIGWRRNKIAMVPLNVEGRVCRGQCMSCTVPLRQPPQQQQQPPQQQQQQQAQPQQRLPIQALPQAQPAQLIPREVTVPASQQQSQQQQQQRTALPPPQPLRKVLSLIDDEDGEEEIFVFSRKAGTYVHHNDGAISDGSGRDSPFRHQRVQRPQPQEPQPPRHHEKLPSKQPMTPPQQQGPSVFYEGDLNIFGQPDGKGEMIFASGDRYHGQFANGKIHGHGTMLFENGSQYVGPWELGYMHGSGGTFQFANGDVYTGDYQHSKRSGQGRMQFANGDLYFGSWQDGHMHGLGQYHYHNGHKFAGTFVMGARHGKGKYQYADGETVIHRYVHDHRMGEGVQFSADRTKVWRSVGGKRKGRITQRQAEVIMLRCDEEE